MRRWLLVVAALIGICCAARLAYSDGQPVQAGGYTDEVCTGQGSVSPLTVTTGSAYAVSNQVAQVVSLPVARPTVAGGRPSAVLLSTRLVFNDTQVAEFDIRLYTAQPGLFQPTTGLTSTLSDKTAQSLLGTDKPLQLPPIRLLSGDSSAGNTTVYGADNIGRALKISPANNPLMWATITTAGTPSFVDAHPQLCLGVVQD